MRSAEQLDNGFGEVSSPSQQGCSRSTVSPLSVPQGQGGGAVAVDLENLWKYRSRRHSPYNVESTGSLSQLFPWDPHGKLNRKKEAADGCHSTSLRALCDPGEQKSILLCSTKQTSAVSNSHGALITNQVTPILIHSNSSFSWAAILGGIPKSLGKLPTDFNLSFFP
jgi:hypothetical protein